MLPPGLIEMDRRPEGCGRPATAPTRFVEGGHFAEPFLMALRRMRTLLFWRRNRHHPIKLGHAKKFRQHKPLETRASYSLVRAVVEPKSPRCRAPIRHIELAGGSARPAGEVSDPRAGPRSGGGRRAPHQRRTTPSPADGPGKVLSQRGARLSWFLWDMPTGKRELTEPLRGGTRRGRTQAQVFGVANVYKK